LAGVMPCQRWPNVTQLVPSVIVSAPVLNIGGRRFFIPALAIVIPFRAI